MRIWGRERISLSQCKKKNVIICFIFIMQNRTRLVMLVLNVNTFFCEIHPFAVSFTRTYAAYQGKWGAVFWDLSSRYILLDKRAPMWQNTGHGGQITYCTRLGFYGPLHIDRDQTATATQTIPFLSSHSEVFKNDVTGAPCKPSKCK